MLAARNRLSASADFTATTRRGHRSRCGGLVVYLLTPADSAADVAHQASADPIFGLIVGRTVGGSVVRHAVSRRLRHQLRERVGRVPAGSRVVVRALPEAASEDSAQLGADLDDAFRRLDRKVATAQRNVGDS